MKYFTLKWWSCEVEDMHAVLDAYRSLPADLRKLVHGVSLHDARLRRLDLSTESRRLVLELDGCGYDDQAHSYFDTQFRLTYEGLQSLTSNADPDAGLPGPHGYGDLGYDELEVIPSKLYEHRMSGIELQIRFTEFVLWYEDEKGEPSAAADHKTGGG